MSQFRLARLVLMLAAIGAAPAVMNNAIAQNKEDKPAAEQPKGPSVRQEVYKQIDPAAVKALMDAKNYTEIQNRIALAEAVPNLTPYEKYAINRMKVSLYAVTGNDAALLPALNEAIDSGFLTPQEKDNFLYSIAETHYRAKQYPQAIEAAKRYQKEGSKPAQVRDLLIRSEYLSGDYAAAKNDLLLAIADTEKAGQTPSKQDLKLLASAAHESKDNATMLLALEKVVTYYPTDDDWGDLIKRGVLHKPGYNGQENDINVARLEYSAVQKMPADFYTDVAQTLLATGFFTEAKKVMDMGFANGVLGSGADAAKQRQLRDKANKSAADDAKTIASGEAKAAASKNGAGLVNLGWAYVTMDQFDKGIGFIQQGIAKGGLKQPDEAKLRLGIAQFRAGHKDEAIKTLEQVKAGGGLSDLARYWILLINHPTPATAAANK